jgi:uncharacterized SAM-binding protein YcdF (DUF218 family)
MAPGVLDSLPANGKARANVRTLLRLFAITVGIALVYAAGFLYFVMNLPAAETAPPHADGIVALTGGHARLDAAVGLLENGAARRLLITGVFETTTKEGLAERVHGGPRFDCCADVDYVAEDTHDNAENAAEWARAHGFHSLIVVTARYHMPRTLVEFSTAMPDIRLVPFPVEPAGATLKGWWAKPGTLHLLHGEYAKYLAAVVMSSIHRGEAKISPGKPATRKAGITS